MSVFILYSADANLSYSSYTVEAVTTTKEKAIELVLPILKREAKKTYKDATYSKASEMVADLIDNLNNLSQTQTLGTNYVIREHMLNQFDCL
jgi:hypothetical protein